LFEKFNATFFEGFRWSGDETVKVDTAKLTELFDRYFESEDYPTLDELRETVSFIATFTEEGVNYDHSVDYPKDFDEVSDFFEENLESSFKAGLDACRNQSHSSTPVPSVRAQKREEPLPDEPKELVREAQEILKRIAQLKSEERKLDKRRAQILAHCPRLKIAWEDERTGEISEKPVSGAERVRVYLPRSRTVETVRKLPTQAMTEDEKKVQKDARKLSLDCFVRYREIEEEQKRLRLIEKRAEKIKEAKDRLRSIEEAVQENQEPESKFIHGDENFTSFTFLGKQYFVTPRQGGVIKILYKAHQSGNPWVSGEKILKELRAGKELRDTFRRTEAEDLWGTLIVKAEKKDSFRLDI